jgi:hypothetical protein
MADVQNDLVGTIVAPFNEGRELNNGNKNK